MLQGADRRYMTANSVIRLKDVNQSPSGKNAFLIIYNLHHSTRVQLEWADGCRRIPIWFKLAIANSS